MRRVGQIVCRQKGEGERECEQFERGDAPIHQNKRIKTARKR
jgi:hypothetical protein